MTHSIDLQLNSFELEMKNSDVPILVDFSATWCSPCKQQEPVLNDLANEMDGLAKVVKIDVDEHQDVAIHYQVMSVPTLLLFQKGEIAKKWIGFTSKEELKQTILKYSEQ